MSQEALKTQTDNLQWEVNRLDMENKTLREDYSPKKSRFVELQNELSLAQEDISNLNAELSLQRQQLSERNARIAEDKRKLMETTNKMEELTIAVEDLGKTKSLLETAKLKCTELEAQLVAVPEEMNSRLSHLSETCDMIQREKQQLMQEGELQRYWDIEEERNKWEAREATLVKEIAELKCRLEEVSSERLSERLSERGTLITSDFGQAKRGLQSGGSVRTTDMFTVYPSVPVVGQSTDMNTSVAVSAVVTPVVSGGNQLLTNYHTPDSNLHDVSDVTVTSVISPLTQRSSKVMAANTGDAQSRITDGGVAAQPLAHVGSYTIPCSRVSISAASCLSSSLAGGVSLLPATRSTLVQPFSTITPLYGNQLPPISRFTGEESAEMETFSDWLEQFEAVAGWTEHAKLVNLTTRLRGTAYSFYRSCASEQRSNYGLLVEQLRKRFTPVQLTAIQSQRFHDCRQSANETVDEFAQELDKLFHKAYFNLIRGGTEAEAMGQSVLANQFISGLQPVLKLKVVGTEGNLEQLLAKARFEEAKLRELPGSNPKKTPPVTGSPSNPNTSSTPKGFSRQQGNQADEPKGCYNCGMVGHLKKSCPYPRYNKSGQEAPGKRNAPNQKNTSVAQLIVPSESGQNSGKQKVEELRRALREAELTVTLEECTVIVNGVVPTEKNSTELGPTVTIPALVNGVKVDALVDTGSLVTILSLKFAMVVLSQEQNQFKSIIEWKVAMKERLKSPDIVLTGYSGERLNILAQLKVTISQGEYAVTVTALI